MKEMCFIPLFIAMVTVTVATAGDMPSSARSREAIQRIRPLLEKRLKGMGLRWGAPVFMRIFKAENHLQVWLHDGLRFKLFKTFNICTYGQKELGPKTTVGDGRAPEGFYQVWPRQLNPYSRFYLAFNLGYPNAYDRTHGRTGSALMVHGSCVSIGCFAMTDTCMDSIYALADAALRNGQSYFRVHIFPFKMTDQRMARLEDPTHASEMAQWTEFWKELKIGYDYFKRYQQPPYIRVKNGRYLFSEDY